MIQLGHYAILASLCFCAYGMVAGVWGGKQRNLALIRSAENAVIANFVLIGTASISLWYLLLTNNFLVKYVTEYSSVDMPTHFKFTAFWGGQAGSLLLWALVLAVFGTAAIVQNRHSHRALMPWVAVCSKP